MKVMYIQEVNECIYTTQLQILFRRWWQAAKSIAVLLMGAMSLVGKSCQPVTNYRKVKNKKGEYNDTRRSEEKNCRRMWYVGL